MEIFHIVLFSRIVMLVMNLFPFFPGMMRVPQRGLRPSGLYCEGPGLASDMLAKNSLIFSETSTNMIIAVNGNQSNQVAHQHVNQHKKLPGLPYISSGTSLVKERHVHER